MRFNKFSKEELIIMAKGLNRVDGYDKDFDKSHEILIEITKELTKRNDIIGIRNVV